MNNKQFLSELSARCRIDEKQASDGVQTLVSVMEKVFDSGDTISISGFGHFHCGVQEGQGTFTWSSGAVYTGSWKQNKQNGSGKYTWANGDVYEGQWKDGVMEGEGIIRQADGAKFKGNFHNGMKEGPGVLEDVDGVRYEGTFHEDKKDGEFIEKDKNGETVRKVTYVNGIVSTPSPSESK